MTPRVGLKRIFFETWMSHDKNFMIWPRTDHFGHFNQERHLLEEFLLIQNQVQPKCHKKR
jgi:hypothetical protein